MINWILSLFGRHDRKFLTQKEFTRMYNEYIYYGCDQ